MVKRLVKLVILIPLGILIVVLSVANRHDVRLALNPFNPDDSLLAITLPFFIFLFLAMMLGVLIGSVATWFSQGAYRKKARNEAHSAKKWREEADKQKTRVENMTTRKLISASSN